MLARIIHFKGLAGTTMGTVALGAGAIDDAMAWCMLAVVLASFDHEPAHAFLNIGGGAAYVAVAMWVIRPSLARLQRWLVEDGTLRETGLAVGLALMAVGAWFTDRIGLHAVFGAFIMGAAMPRGAFTRDIIPRVQPLTVAPITSVVLHLFRIKHQDRTAQFGLPVGRLRRDSVGSSDWERCGMLVGRPSDRTDKPRGDRHRHLMNARGLMELIIINIGLERGVISEGLFATLVIMAVVTTFMASPVFDRLAGAESHRGMKSMRRKPLSPP